MVVLVLSNLNTPRRLWLSLSSRAVLSIFFGYFISVELVSAGSISSKDYLLKYPKALRSTMEEFFDHQVIKPEIHHARHKRAIKDTFVIEEGGHTPHITLSYHHHGHKVVADLHLNEDLFPEGYFMRFQNSSNGADTVHNFTKADVDLCHYQGTIRGKPNSRVAVSTCNGGVNGVVYDVRETYFIHSQEDGSLEDDHFLFKRGDLMQNSTCEDDNSGSDSDANDLTITSQYNRILRYKRSNAASNLIRGPYNANKHSSFVELVIVVDQSVFKSFGRSLKKVHKYCQDLANIMNALYVPLNIYVALVGVVVWSESDEIEISSNIDDTLNNFLRYRQGKLSRSHPNDNAHLLTMESFERSVLGAAKVEGICSLEASGGVSSKHSPIVAAVASTMAHEMGHNFGMHHDTPGCKCEDKECIMSNSSCKSMVLRHWSSCSVDHLNEAFSRGIGYCLRNKPTKLFASPQCGNGFVEPGEQCDCGPPEYCENSCCDPTTCMLRTNATCATGECCDLSTCRPKTAGIECRSTEGECDLSEFCTGESEYCPLDVFRRDTEECGNGNAFCYQGSCKSHDQQCKILWGPSGNSADLCYSNNVEGSRSGNCGYDPIEKKLMQCQQEDVLCGMLHCRHSSQRPMIGNGIVTLMEYMFENNVEKCSGVVINSELESTDAGLTPNGAKCGDKKMCVNQKCVAIKTLHAKGRGVPCPEDCNGNGICNSNGQCHCFADFEGPTCNKFGYGGSEDSGPATNANIRLTFKFNFLFTILCYFIILQYG